MKRSKTQAVPEAFSETRVLSPVKRGARRLNLVSGVPKVFATNRQFRSGCLSASA